jgi:hypothetical protein
MVPTISFPVSTSTTAESVMTLGVMAVFSLRLTLEAVVEGATEFVVEVNTEGTEDVDGRERQTNFIIFSSNSAHNGTIRSSSSAHTIKTRSSRCTSNN